MDIHRTFLQTKYKWSCSTWASIAWDSFQLCAHRLRLDNASNRSKLVHNWLNLGAQRAKHGPTSTQTDTIRACPYCSLPEDFQHLLTCAAPRALKFRYDATEKLRKTLSNSVGDNTILRAVKQWTHMPSDTMDLTSEVPDFQHAIDRAVARQTTIGWINMFRGFISLEWGHIYSLTDYSTSWETRQSQSTHQLALVICALQDYSLAIWKSRNDVLHENSELSRSILQDKLHHDITTLYALGPTYSPIIQSYFSISLEDRLKRPLRHKQRWLRLAYLATSHATSKGSRQQVMSTYFPYTPSEAPLATTHSVLPSPVPLTLLQQVPIHHYFQKEIPKPHD